jgi:hypothetical protein
MFLQGGHIGRQFILMSGENRRPTKAQMLTGSLSVLS